MADKNDRTADFVLGNKAADLWLYTSDACASDKVIPKKCRYTTGTSLMNDADSICELIEGANLIDLREEPRERIAMQKQALNRCIKFERKILRMLESKQYPGVNERKAAAWTKQILTVRYMCAAWHGKDKERAAHLGMDARRR
ncbi:MAG: hypothetical protein RR365_15165 [Bacteroides sp.]